MTLSVLEKRREGRVKRETRGERETLPVAGCQLVESSARGNSSSSTADHVNATRGVVVLGLFSWRGFVLLLQSTAAATVQFEPPLASTEAAMISH